MVHGIQSEAMGTLLILVAATDPSQPDYIRFAQNQPFVFGYDVTGTEKTTSDYPASSRLAC